MKRVPFGKMATSDNVLGGNALNDGHASCGKDSDNCGTNVEHTAMMSTSIFDAVKSGMLLPVQKFVEHYGDAVLQSRDNEGHTPAHWACYGGHIFILQCIIDHKGPINNCSNSELAQRPIHWACVYGHVPIVDLLLQNGVSIDETDNKGVTPLIVSSQYGMTMLAAYLIGKGAALQVVDADGDTALHWAAFKGHSELMRLLIYSGLSPHQKDKYGQAPIHLASICGSLTAVKELRQQENVVIDEADINGKTPLVLAAGRKHYTVVKYLKDELHMKTSFCFIPKLDMWTILFGPPGSQKGALMFFIINMLCWGYPMYIFKILPETWYAMPNVHVFFMCVNLLMWATLYKAVTMDPGFLPTNTSEYHLAVKQVTYCTNYQEIQNRLGRLCHTCRTVKPLRSKHCRTCNRCVTAFDHHCPYIYNCVGYNNRVWFLLFVWMVSTVVECGIWMAFYILINIEHDVLVFIGLTETIFFAIISHIILTFGVYQAAVNLTTNERINWFRYTYLQDGVGNFYNAFNRGLVANVLEFLHLKETLSESEAMFLNVKVV